VGACLLLAGNRQLLARPDPVLRLEVDQDVCPLQPLADQGLELVGGAMGLLE
jgi:hypothetical protein